MIKIKLGAMPCAEAELRSSMSAYKAALTAHSQTVGEPAPLPAYDILRSIVWVGVKDGPVNPGVEVFGDFVVVPDDDPQPEAPPTYADLRRAEYNRRGVTIEALTVAVVEHLGGHSEELMRLAQIRNEVKALIPKE